MKETYQASYKEEEISLYNGLKIAYFKRNIMKNRIISSASSWGSQSDWD
jgi:hypothetical protein